MDRPLRTRRGRWTLERQLAFLDALVRTRNVTKAARAAGMSRESAYRMRNRSDNGLFAMLWDRILASPPIESHTAPLTDGALARLLGMHFRRESSDFSSIEPRMRKAGGGDRTWRL